VYSLCKPICETYRYKRKKLRLNLSFDRVLKIFELLQNDFFCDEEKLKISLRLLVVNYRSIQRYVIMEQYEIFDEIMKTFVNQEKANGEKNDEKVIDYTEDAQYIFSSFYKDYGMDLYEMQGKLHWFKFLSLLTGLSSDTKMRQILDIRTQKIPAPTAYNREEIERLRNLKAFYALKISSEDKEKQYQSNLSQLAQALEKMAVKV